MTETKRPQVSIHLVDLFNIFPFLDMEHSEATFDGVLRISSEQNTWRLSKTMVDHAHQWGELDISILAVMARCLLVSRRFVP